MTGSTRKHTLRIPAGLSPRLYNPEAAADFDSSPLYLNPQRLSPVSPRVTKKASSTLQKILLQRARGRTEVKRPIHSTLWNLYLFINGALWIPQRSHEAVHGVAQGKLLRDDEGHRGSCDHACGLFSATGRSYRSQVVPSGVTVNVFSWILVLPVWIIDNENPGQDF